MKYQESQTVSGYGGFTQTLVRVSEGDTLPEGATQVAEETPVHDWQPEVAK